jgi:hypothetical protein
MVPCRAYDDLQCSASSFAGKILTKWKNNIREIVGVSLEKSRYMQFELSPDDSLIQQ